MAKGGTLANIGQALSGYGSALSGNPMYLQNSLLLRQAQQQQAEQEAAKQREQMQSDAVRSMMRAPMAGTGTPEAKSYQVNGRTIGQTVSAGPDINAVSGRGLMLQQALGPTFDKAFLGTKVADVMAQLGMAQPNYVTVGDNLVQTNAIGGPKAVFDGRKAPEGFKVGTTRTVQRGGQNITEEYQGDGKWSEIGSGPAWKPDAPKEEKDTFGDQAKLRGEFDTKTKDFATTRDAYSRVVNVASNPSPAGDISLIFSFMKMNDPNSTVREGEYATAQNAGSVPQRVWGIYNKVLSGESLTPAQRADFVAQAGNLYGSQVNSFSQEYKRYSDLAQKYGFSADRVVYDRTAGLPAAMPIQQAAGTANAAAPTSAPRATNPVTGETVEWNGTEWAKVK